MNSNYSVVGNVCCVHGHLARSCEICELQTRINDLLAARAMDDEQFKKDRAEIDRLKEEYENYRIGGAEIIAGATRDITTLRAEVERLTGIIGRGEKLVEDFMRNIKSCVLQDYGLLNTFLTESRVVRETRNNGVS